MKKKIDFYFDFLSPYSYLAWTWLRQQPLEITYIPVSIASIVTHYETKGPAQIKPKRNYLFKDLLRFTKLNQIPFTTPAQLPFNSLYALRLSLNSVALEQQKLVIDTLFRAGWEYGLDIGNDDILKQVLSVFAPTEDLFARMEARESRIDLKKNIELALERGVFGVPTFFVDEEMFWGNDSIKYLQMYLEGNDPLEKEDYENFISKHQF